MSKLLRNGLPRKADGKLDLSWKTHYGFTGFIVLCGFLFPPLAVAVRFGIGRDFFINVLLTCCAIIPGHIHNWFIQNVRNNDTKARTPKWAIRYGLVDDRARLKLEKEREGWTGRYRDRVVGERVVYDEEGNAHVVDDEGGDKEEEREMRGKVGLGEQRTGLVEPDEWINRDPSQPKIDYSYQEVQPQRTGLARFRRGKGQSSAHAPLPEEEPSMRRRGRSDTIQSSDSEGSTPATPEEATRTFVPHSTTASAWVDSRKSSIEPPAPVRHREEDDIFSHEF